MREHVQNELTISQIITKISEILVLRCFKLELLRFFAPGLQYWNQ